MGDGQTEGGSNSILSITGIESRLATLEQHIAAVIPGAESRLLKLEQLIAAVLPAAEKGIVSVGTDVAAIAGEIGAVVAAPTLLSVAGVVVPISSAAMDILNVFANIVAIIENPPATPSVGTLTGAEVAGPNAAKS